MDLHKTERGKELIENLYYQMNNYRLSTNLLKKNIDSVQLHNEINSLLTGIEKSSIELLIYNPETNNNKFLMSFPSVYSCAKYLNVTKYRINQGLKNNKSIIIDNKTYYVKIG